MDVYLEDPEQVLYPNLSFPQNLTYLTLTINWGEAAPKIQPEDFICFKPLTRLRVLDYSYVDSSSNCEGFFMTSYLILQNLESKNLEVLSMWSDSSEEITFEMNGLFQSMLKFPHLKELIFQQRVEFNDVFQTKLEQITLLCLHQVSVLKLAGLFSLENIRSFEYHFPHDADTDYYNQVFKIVSQMISLEELVLEAHSDKRVALEDQCFNNFLIGIQGLEKLRCIIVEFTNISIPKSRIPAYLDRYLYHRRFKLVSIRLELVSFSHKEYLVYDVEEENDGYSLF